MTIKQFLIIVFCVLFSLAIYLNIRYLKGAEFQKNNQPIEYYNIRETYCHTIYRMSSHMTIFFNRKSTLLVFLLTFVLILRWVK